MCSACTFFSGFGFWRSRRVTVHSVITSLKTHIQHVLVIIQIYALRSFSDSRLTEFFLLKHTKAHLHGTYDATSRAINTTRVRTVRLLETSLFFTKCGKAGRAPRPQPQPRRRRPRALRMAFRSDRRHSWASPRSGCCRTAQSRGAYARRRT